MWLKNAILSLPVPRRKTLRFMTEFEAKLVYIAVSCSTPEAVYLTHQKSSMLLKTSAREHIMKTQVPLWPCYLCLRKKTFWVYKLTRLPRLGETEEAVFTEKKLNHIIILQSSKIKEHNKSYNEK